MKTERTALVDPRGTRMHPPSPPQSNFFHVHAVLGANWPHNSLASPHSSQPPPVWENLDPVAFWVTNPCRNTRKVKQTKMYVCTLEEFILVDLDTLLCKLEVICIGKCCSLYTIATMDEKCEINS